MLNTKHFLNKLKINKLKKIEKQKYIYIFRYNNLNNKEIILLKKKNNQLNFIILKQNLIKFLIKDLKIQGPLLLVYSNNDIIIKNFIFFNINKLKLVSIINGNNFFSNIKLNNIFSKQEIFLNIQFKIFVNNFLYFLKNIKNKADIT